MKYQDISRQVETLSMPSPQNCTPSLQTILRNVTNFTSLLERKCKQGTDETSGKFQRSKMMTNSNNQSKEEIADIAITTSVVNKDNRDNLK